MQVQKLHIVSFDNPFPPKYGGVIDVFYKIKALHELGIEIYLHCFVEVIPRSNPELESITKKVFYYKRNKSKLKLLSKLPFPVISRKHPELLHNLNFDDSPILFEGVHTTSVLVGNKFDNRRLFLRLHNLEDKYYLGLCRSATNILKKTAYFLESKKYEKYQKIIHRFDAVFTLSKFETEFVEARYKNAYYVPVFHGNMDLQELTEFGRYAIYNGDLRISDNIKAAEFLINVFKKIPDYNFVIASSVINERLYAKCKSIPNISYEIIRNEEHLVELLEDAHINVMYSFQESGTKLKVINGLYKSRFCVINKNMLDDVDLQSLCVIAERESDFVKAINILKTKPYSGHKSRRIILEKVLNDEQNALKVMQVFDVKSSSV